MEPNRFGRVLGVGARIAAEKLRERTAQRSPSAARSVPASQPAPAASGRPAARPSTASSTQGYAEGGRRLARGAGRFGGALWRPFAHATGVLSLQITGVFFAIFTLFFTIHAWQIFKTAGLRDSHFIVYAVCAMVFAWFTVTSFWRARRKQQHG